MVFEDPYQVSTDTSSSNQSLPVVSLLLLTIKTPSDLAGKLSPFSAKNPKLELGQRKTNPPVCKLLKQVHGDCNG